MLNITVLLREIECHFDCHRLLELKIELSLPIPYPLGASILAPTALVPQISNTNRRHCMVAMSAVQKTLY